MVENAKASVTGALRWSEKYAKTDMVYLASGGFWLSVGQGTASLGAFVLSILFANFLPAETYGTYKYVLSLAGMLGIFTLGGMHTSLMRAVARGEDGAAPRALRARLLGGVVGSLVALSVSAWHFYTGQYEVSLGLLIVAAALPFMEAFGTYDAVLQGKSAFRTSTTYFALSSALATLALVLAIFLSGDVYALLLAYFGTWTLTRIIAWRMTAKLLVPSEGKGEGVVLYGVQLSAIGILNAVAGQLDKVLLFHFLGPIQLAVYSFAVAVPEQIRNMLKGLLPLALARFSRRSAAEIKETLSRKALQSLLATVPIIIAYVCAAPYVYSLLFPAYMDAVLPSQVFALSLLVAPVFLYIAAFQSQAAKKLMVANDTLTSAVQIALLVALIPLYGIWGAVIARLLGRLGGVVIAAALAKHL